MTDPVRKLSSTDLNECLDEVEYGDIIKNDNTYGLIAENCTVRGGQLKKIVIHFTLGRAVLYTNIITAHFRANGPIYVLGNIKDCLP